MAASNHDFALTWLEQHGDMLFGYALSRVGGDAAVAEDLVQETLLAGIKGYDRFKGQSNVATWLTAILRRKIIDYYRSRGRQQGRQIEVVDSWDGILDEVADIRPWSENATASIENRELREVFDSCLAALNPLLAEAFVATIMEEQTTEDTCKLLGISATNLSVRVHRARLSLRKCLQHKWFGSR